MDVMEPGRALSLYIAKGEATEKELDRLIVRRSRQKDSDEECPRCGRRLWWVVEVEMPRADERLRAFAEEVMRRDREMLDENRARVGLPPWGPSGSGSRRGRTASKGRGGS